MAEVEPEEYIITTIKRCNMYQKWLARDDAILYSKVEVLFDCFGDDSFRPIGKRGIFKVKNLDQEGMCINNRYYNCNVVKTKINFK